MKILPLGISKRGTAALMSAISHLDKSKPSDRLAFASVLLIDEALASACSRVRAAALSKR